jgi:hypothetical protein
MALGTFLQSGVLLGSRDFHIAKKNKYKAFGFSFFGITKNITSTEGKIQV